MITELIEHLQDGCNEVVEGNLDGLLLLSQLKKLESEIERIKTTIMPTCMKELENSISGTTRSFDNWGASFSLTAGGRYNYDSYPTHKDYSNRLKAIENKMQAAFKTGGIIIDDETGEVIPPAEYVANKPSITIKFKK